MGDAIAEKETTMSAKAILERIAALAAVPVPGMRKPAKL